MEHKLAVKYAQKSLKKQNVMHTSGYARAQSGSSMGASSSQSFTTRRSIDSNRKIVKGYKDSDLMRKRKFEQNTLPTEPVVAKPNNIKPNIKPTFRD